MIITNESVDEPLRPRVLVAMEPAVLEGALALLLTSREAHDVVEFHAATEAERGARFDAAVVSRALAGGVSADMVIVLPDAGSSGGSGVGHVTTAGARREVPLRSHQQVLDLLHEQFALAVSRPGPLAGG